MKQLLPVPPAGLRATKTNEGIVLSWDSPAIANLKVYKIYREKLGEGKRFLAEVNKEKTVYNDAESNSGTYFYTITSVLESNEESKPCEEIGVT